MQAVLEQIRDITSSKKRGQTLIFTGLSRLQALLLAVLKQPHEALRIIRDEPYTIDHRVVRAVLIDCVATADTFASFDTTIANLIDFAPPVAFGRRVCLEAWLLAAATLESVLHAKTDDIMKGLATSNADVVDTAPKPGTDGIGL